MNGGVLWGRPRPGRGCSATYGWMDGFLIKKLLVCFRKKFRRLFRFHIFQLWRFAAVKQSRWQRQCVTVTHDSHHMVWNSWTAEWGYPSCLLGYKMIFRWDYRTARRNTLQAWIGMHVLYKRVIDILHTSAHSPAADYCTRGSNVAKPTGYTCDTIYDHS